MLLSLTPSRVDTLLFRMDAFYLFQHSSADQGFFALKEYDFHVQRGVLAAAKEKSDQIAREIAQQGGTVPRKVFLPTRYVATCGCC